MRDKYERVGDIMADESRINDGIFEIAFKEDGVYLTVYPPSGRGKRVEINDVVEHLSRKRVRNFNKAVVEATVMRCEQIAVKIAEPQEETKIDAAVSVHITEDKMKASVILSAPEGGRALSKEEILLALSQAGVVSGIKEGTLEDLAKYPVYNVSVEIAEGSQAVNGQNGRVEFLFDVSKDRKPTILDDGRVDYRELNLIDNVTTGQELCRLIPPLEGIPGKNVLGKEIPALSGKAAILPKGRNVEIDNTGNILYSCIDGMVEYIDGKVHVFSNYEVPANVDNSTGNIKFAGNISVKGNILSGFVVEAGGNVEVWGTVEAATIKADGDIILRRGIQGAGKGLLVSGNNIISRYIENCTVEAKNNIKAEAVMHSVVRCGNKLELSGKKGLLVGGTCKVGKEIEAKVVGSYMSTNTDIELGIDPGIRERYKNLKQTIADMENDITKADQAITVLKKLESSGMLSPEKKEMLQKSIKTKLYFTNVIQEHLNEMAEIEEKLKSEAKGILRVNSYLYPGTKIAIGSSSMFIKEVLQYCSIYRDGIDIRIGAFDKRV